MSAQHTQTPWHVGAQNDAIYIFSGTPPAKSNDNPFHDADRAVVAHVYDVEHARRIVACVNACDGISNHELEQWTYKDLMDLVVRGGVMELQRDELLAALKKINDTAMSHPYAGTTCGDIARAAIAKAEGK